MPEQKIRMVTTDSIPGEHRAVTDCTVAWGAGEDILKAYESLKKWARESNYQDIVGIRFVVTQDVQQR